MNKNLYNKKNKKQLLDQLENEKFKRITCSFYKYVELSNLIDLRNEIFAKWTEFEILGRVYIAEEGINAQISIPQQNIKKFKRHINSKLFFRDILIKSAIKEGLSFYKLTVKIKNEIVAYRLNKDEYNIKKVGNHLNYKEFHKKIDKGAIIVDVRNDYESEVGHFKNALLPKVEKSDELLPEIKKMLKGKEEQAILMYCTGGIRCEKASSYLIKNGYKNVNQLKGGIIQYAHDIKMHKIKSRFIGTNFVFDHRFGEQITNDIISYCHQCDSPSNRYLDCANQACHILFIQCLKCSKKYNNCCTKECADFIQLSEDNQKKIIKSKKFSFSAQKTNKIKPKLKELRLKGN